MMKTTWHAAIALALSLFAFQAAHAEDQRPAQNATAETKPVVVFAAASLKTALDRVTAEWKTKTGQDATLSYGASSALAKQIDSGAPADLFVSANLKWMDWLDERKRITERSRKNLLGNALVLIAPKASDVKIEIAPGFDLTAALGDGRLAMGEPSSVPAGLYGKAALESLGVWDSVAAKVAGAANVRVALTYVARGETPLGIVYATDANSEPDVKVIDTFPPDTHPPIVYPAALTATSKNAGASAFLDFLSSPEASAIFEDEGFTVLE